MTDSIFDLLNGVQKENITDPNSRVLITGDAGTGKKLIAQNIHQNSIFSKSLCTIIDIKNKSDNEHEVIELLDDINRDLNNYDLEFRIQELESKFSKDLSETTFNELKELKKKQNIN